MFLFQLISDSMETDSYSSFALRSGCHGNSNISCKSASLKLAVYNIILCAACLQYLSSPIQVFQDVKLFAFYI